MNRFALAAVALTAATIASAQTHAPGPNLSPQPVPAPVAFSDSEADRAEVIQRLATAPIAGEAVGDAARHALAHLEWLIGRHPLLRVTLFTTPDWRSRAAAPAEEVAFIGCTGNRLQM